MIRRDKASVFAFCVFRAPFQQQHAEALTSVANSRFEASNSAEILLGIKKYK
jgi:hypothetical protein